MQNRHPSSSSLQLIAIGLVAWLVSSWPHASTLGAMQATAIDMFFYDPLAPAQRAVAGTFCGDVPTIILRDKSTGQAEVWAFLIDHLQGARVGQTMQVPLSLPMIPQDVIWSSEFFPGGTVLIGQELTLVGIPVTMLPDGTPQAGPLVAAVIGNPQVSGQARCLGEMPAVSFADGKARLIVGTDLGRVLVIELVGGQPQVTGTVMLGSSPVTAVGPIPQLNDVLLGAVTDDHLIGIDLEPALLQGAGASSQPPTVIFSLAEPRPDPLVDFGVFEPNDEPLTDPTTKVTVGLANGTNEVALADIPAAASGTNEFIVKLAEPRPDPVWQLVLGSLLTLSPSGELLYELDFDAVTGGGDCVFEVLNPSYLVGDADGSTTVTSSDIIQLVNHVFKSGQAPCPPYVGDTNCSAAISSADIIVLVNYVFKGGAAPCSS
jgi:hypothetical protein